MGLGQIMPFNLKEAGITNAWNPRQNIFGAARLLRGHLNTFGSRPDGTLLAVAAYNAGPNAVRRAGYKVPNGSQVQRYVWKCITSTKRSRRTYSVDARVSTRIRNQQPNPEN
jgi:soluble lytic murein transglycosylase-like protein